MSLLPRERLFALRARPCTCSIGSESPTRSVDITGDEALEQAYREWLPVVEIDGERAFVYYVDEAALRRKVSPAS